MQYRVIIAGKPVEGFQTCSARRAHEYVQRNYPRAYARKDYRIAQPPTGATIRWRLA